MRGSVPKRLQLFDLHISVPPLKKIYAQPAFSSIGADILVPAAPADDFESASGQYIGNDEGRFASHHADAPDPRKSEEIVRAIEAVPTEKA